ncbi:V-type H+-transporting ATPase subunit C [Marchantia polymorpha subsp. ruderalis]|uniref:V-type proton ATPase subunit C n=2 Tax=Marchantia polymorpha TaxID=3197 RepID=A0AAF6BBR3_MARPO|nr:hypothetical protein MARPO_0126s0013 [Marchantia polymorpha]PTQ30296.1 hypothetical protein MARPO_0126s0013 [Marchantia polymorpha]BBN09446.1 hypothetical protein Mp_4g19810 [Marchantia polymorpha subsp. ruderalis]BBN09447.1 hypothetical protein Mp_4g19810 [Marchantia polymorpha subsp. ruderalis]|eukprot:PTQ30295.1 hypothetical protein MARPO_0126s0013 [Marchantia polymorpha]
MASRYCLISLPLQDSVPNTWSLLQNSINKVAFDIPTYKFHIPELRVGTLDSLLTLSDDLSKANSVVEAITHKIRRQIEELERATGHENTSLTVDGVPIDSYITRFSWDEAKYPVMSPLRETVDTIHETVVKLEDDLKVRVAEYNNVKSQLTAINRKQTGSMAVRDLSNLLHPEDIVSSEHLTTLLVVVGKYSQKEWLTSYEAISTFVVPRSSKKIHEDNEYALYTVVLFRRVSDTFKTAAREKGYQVRDYEFDPENKQQKEEELKRLSEDQENLRSSLQQWCYASYGEVFSAWMHICAVRIFTESILRYGLPPAFLAAVLAPSSKNEKKVRVALDNLSNKGGNNSSFWKADDDSVGMAGLTGGDTEVHPYVSLTVNLSA